MIMSPAFGPLFINPRASPPIYTTPSLLAKLLRIGLFLSFTGSNSAPGCSLLYSSRFFLKCAAIFNANFLLVLLFFQSLAFCQILCSNAPITMSVTAIGHVYGRLQNRPATIQANVKNLTGPRTNMAPTDTSITDCAYLNKYSANTYNAPPAINCIQGQIPSNTRY